MNLSDVKLVVTDMDGTLLNENGEISPNFYNVYDALKANNIHFVAASGRQYYSIVEKLNEIKNDITIIAENGGITKRGNLELAKTLLSKDNTDAIIPLLRTINDVFIVLCGKNKAYIETKDLNFPKLLSEYYTEFDTVEDLTTVNHDEFLKIAIYHPTSSETYIYPHVKHLESDLQVKVSGQNWLDISHKDANKGFALQNVQKALGITENETMVFGDYNNDLEMFERAYFSYAMANAHPNVKQVARFETKSNNEQGVEFILEQLIASKQK